MNESNRPQLNTGTAKPQGLSILNDYIKRNPLYLMSSYFNKDCLKIRYTEHNSKNLFTVNLRCKSEFVIMVFAVTRPQLNTVTAIDYKRNCIIRVVQ